VIPSFAYACSRVLLRHDGTRCRFDDGRWVIAEINGDAVTTDKAAVMSCWAAAMKSGPLRVGFRVPTSDGVQHCATCDKFLDAAEFEASELRKGPGKQTCNFCAEFASCL